MKNSSFKNSKYNSFNVDPDLSISNRKTLNFMKKVPGKA